MTTRPGTVRLTIELPNDARSLSDILAALDAHAGDRPLTVACDNAGLHVLIADEARPSRRPSTEPDAPERSTALLSTVPPPSVAHRGRPSRYDDHWIRDTWTRLDPDEAIGPQLAALGVPKGSTTTLRRRAEALGCSVGARPTNGANSSIGQTIPFDVDSARRRAAESL